MVEATEKPQAGVRDSAVRGADPRGSRRGQALSTVVDSSVVVAALVDTGALGTWAERTLEGGSLYAPELLRVEVANSLRRLETSKRITPLECDAAYEDFMQLQVELLPYGPFAERVWELRHGVTSYDAWYVAIAEAIEAPLATLDGRLVRAMGPRCRFLTPDHP